MTDRRVSEIMKHLSRNFGLHSNTISDNNFEVSPPLTGLDHRVFIKFERSGDIIRVEIRYLFGNLNDELDISSRDLLDMLVENNGSFQGTSAYLSIKVMDAVPIVFLNSYHCFLAKWEDRDIAEIIQLQLMDIKMGLISWSYPESISLFREARE